ncbi:unnamed protein product [Strongylus vulgaris]|uniref:CID domain-containing protein n=1 Tax=Strongylus vulgaris TaxID=40348 RepID=A0A3P7HYG6_STRVU|nr:unnamed protein product [Strongylus vulgaris]
MDHFDASVHAQLLAKRLGGKQVLAHRGSRKQSCHQRFSARCFGCSSNIADDIAILIEIVKCEVVLEPIFSSLYEIINYASGPRSTAMTGLTMDAVMRRFQDIHSVSQEAIETISLWVMHYKDKRSIDTIVEAWLETKKDEQRIALFYVMNDVVQRAKNKHMDVLIPAFQPAVLSAVTMGKGSPSVKQVMSRCIDIFGERQVFTEASVNVMKNMLRKCDCELFTALEQKFEECKTFYASRLRQSEENGEGDESFAELDSEEVYRKIELFERGRLIVNRGMEVIRNGDFDCRALMKERMRGDFVILNQLGHTMPLHRFFSQKTPKKLHPAIFFSFCVLWYAYFFLKLQNQRNLLSSLLS